MGYNEGNYFQKQPEANKISQPVIKSGVMNLLDYIVKVEYFA